MFLPYWKYRSRTVAVASSETKQIFDSVTRPLLLNYWNIWIYRPNIQTKQVLGCKIMDSLLVFAVIWSRWCTECSGVRNMLHQVTQCTTTYYWGTFTQPMLRIYNFELRHPCCVNQITKYKVDTWSQNTIILTLRRRIKSHLLFAGIIRSSPFSPR